MDYKQPVREYLALHIKDRKLGDDEDFFVLGYVDSLFAMELVLFVEKEFGVSIDGSEMRLENFSTINAISDTVKRERAARAA